MPPRTTKDPRLARAGVSGYNKPKRTPNHPKKSHVVVAKEGDKVKTIRFGQQGVSGSPMKKGESKASAARRKSFKARHAKNIAKGKMSAKRKRVASCPSGASSPMAPPVRPYGINRVSGFDIAARTEPISGNPAF